MNAEPERADRVANLAEVLTVLDEFYPPATALEWDRVGLVTGDPEQPVRRILFAVDPTLAVIDAARSGGADLLISHHPLLLRGVNSVATTNAKGAAVTALVVGDIALYTAHTNADIARPGVNDALAAACGLPADCKSLSADGGGRVGDLAEPVTLRAFAQRLAAALPPAPVGVRVSGDPDAIVRRVAVLGGAGDDRFDDVRAAKADVYVTADLRHHPALEAREEGRGGPPYLIDAGHWATESLWLAAAADRLRRTLSERGYTVDTDICTVRTDPWDFLVGSNEPSGADDES
ncbi:Nif3-like dinuclear metal center hexameric protein [Calidifontibacter terrae]